MSLYRSISSWFGKKALSYGLKSMKNIYSDASHPEQYKARDALEANKDAQALRTNNPIISSYSESLQSGVVGTGFTLQYKSKNIKLNNQVEFWLSHYSEYGNCEITGRFFRQDLERFMVSEAGITGGFIIRHHWDKKIPTLYNPEILSTNTIDRTKNDFKKGLYFGVQTNNFGKITGIHIYDNAQRKSSKLIPMKNLILFLDVWTDPHQYTSVTPLAPILNTLDKLASYDDSEVKGAKGRSGKSIIIATEAYSVIVQAQQEYMSKILADSGGQTESSAYKQAAAEYQEILADFSGQGIHEGAIPIMPGEHTKVWDLKTSGDTVYADINQNSKQILSRGIGLSPSTVTGMPESSYNVALKNAQADERKYAIVGQKVIEICLKEIYRNAIEAGYLLGFYDISDFYTNKLQYSSYLKITRKQIGHIDPLKQNLGDETAVEAGFTSHKAVIASRGLDPEEVINDEVDYEIMRKEKFEAKGLKYIQTGTESIELAKEKEEAKQEAVDNTEDSNTKEKDV